MNIYWFIALAIVIGYLIGSIPFALIIGKAFYKVDVRDVGSKNLGATNVARTLGPLAGACVLLCDLTKSGLTSLLMFLLAKSLFPTSSLLPLVYCATGIAVSIGHCYPIFANFKGGKGVATISGFVIFSNWKLLLIGLTIFVLFFLLTRIVSIASMAMCTIASICAFIFPLGRCYFFEQNLFYSLSVLFLSLLLIYKHRPNIIRLIHHEEKKFHFAKTKKDE